MDLVGVMIFNVGIWVYIKKVSVWYFLFIKNEGFKMNFIKN